MLIRIAPIIRPNGREAPQFARRDRREERDQRIRLAGTAGMMLSGGTGAGGGAAPILPTAISGLWAWDKRGDFYSDSCTTLQTTNSGPVQQWSDSSGNGHHLNRTGNRPTLDTSTTHLTKNTIRFDPSGGFKALNFPTQPNVTAAEYFLVAKAASDSPSVNRCVFQLTRSGGGNGTTYPSTSGHILEGFGQAGADQDCGARTLADGFHVLNTGFDTSEVLETRLDSVLINNPTLSSLAFQQAGFFGTDGATARPWDGWAFEFVIFTAKLSSSDRAGLYAYLTS